MSKRALGLLLAPALALFVRSARADEPTYSPYERETIALAARAERGRVEPDPEGKIVEEVLLRPLDVFEPRDPLPGFFEDFLNVFHATTRPFILEREVLQQIGEPWSQRAVDETARNLRSLRQLSLVLCIPLKGSRPDTVKLLVVTKDIWSLRLNSDFRFADGQLEYLVLAPSEENLAGLHHSATVRFTYEPDTYTFGIGYRIPRIGSSWIEAAGSTNLIFNKETGRLEGSSGTFGYGQPLYTTKTEWSYLAGIVWLQEVTRFFQGVTPRTFDAEATPQDDAVPYQWTTEEIAGRYGVTRSFGSRFKHDVSFGAEASRQVYRVPHPERIAPVALREFEREVLPLTDTRVYPFVGYASYSTDFKRYVDFNTLGLQEDYRLWHDVYAKVYPVFDAIGSTRSFLGGAAGASFTTPIGDGLARVYADGSIEAAPERVYDARLLAGARFVSPRLGIGRLVTDGFALRRFENYLNRRSTLGGEGRLRGYPSGAYRGEHVVSYNLELRSTPVELWTVQVGGVGFFDAGLAYDTGADFDLKQSVGVGARIVFPQLDRSVLRVDWALPTELDPEVGVTSVFPGRFTVTFKQAFPMPAVGPPSVLD